MNYREFQVNHAAWLAKMYPDQPPEIPATGCLEEAGELLHCVLKLEQSERWGKLERYGDLEAKLLDAVGDCVVYACSLCNASGWSFEELMCAAGYGWLGSARKLTIHLVRKGTDVALEPEMRLHLVQYVEILRSFCSLCNVDIDRALQSAWAEVKERKRG